MVRYFPLSLAVCDIGMVRRRRIDAVLIPARRKSGRPEHAGCPFEWIFQSHGLCLKDSFDCSQRAAMQTARRSLGGGGVKTARALGWGLSAFPCAACSADHSKGLCGHAAQGRKKRRDQLVPPEKNKRRPDYSPRAFLTATSTASGSNGLRMAATALRMDWSWPSSPLMTMTGVFLNSSFWEYLR